MPDFKRLRELAFDRESRRTGKPEQLRVQLMQVDDGPKFATLTHFWRSGSGEFCPPSRDTLRVTIKRSEAAAVIELLRELMGEPGTPPRGAPARADTASRAQPGLRGVPSLHPDPRELP